MNAREYGDGRISFALYPDDLDDSPDAAVGYLLLQIRQEQISLLPDLFPDVGRKPGFEIIVYEDDARNSVSVIHSTSGG